MASDVTSIFRTAMAVGAHPDDIEFMMAGTLLLLKEAGLDIHMWSLANGCYGTSKHRKEQIIEIRRHEARQSAREAGAVWHPPLVDDLAIIYDAGLLARVSSVVREVAPDILLVPSPGEYMEDHAATARLLVTAAFARGMTAFATDPPVRPVEGDVTIYHAMPYGLRDSLGKLVKPGMYVDIASVLLTKKAMLGKHESQHQWLAASQGIDSYVGEMESMAEEVGTMSKAFEYAEGWRRHSHIGFCPKGADHLSELLGGACRIDEEYNKTLE